MNVEQCKRLQEGAAVVDEMIALAKERERYFHQNRVFGLEVAEGARRVKLVRLRELLTEIASDQLLD